MPELIEFSKCIGTYSSAKFELVYIKEGDAILSLRDKYYSLTPGHLLCMFPNEKIYYAATEGCSWSNLWIGIYGIQADYYIKSLGITREYPIYKCPQPEETEKIINEIIESTENNNSYGKMKTLSKLYDFFASLHDKSAEQVSDNLPVYDIHITDTHEITYLSDNLHIREAENYIRFHYDSNISVHALASILNLSIEYFSRLFKSETGMTPQNMIIKYRIEKACTLLKTTSLSIAEIAMCVGIQDQRYFSKLFRRNIGSSPSKYRKETTSL
ncbi:MAG TPA: AraC family transcriptional regulator [Candidatus Eisenbergiella merdipullorum]|uniref:AraC family transcriptional regulator n=1 Tax=Candidatus Eisenbergiella merdipullorum TaxID=2838553 RepID=A0A9D2I4Z1_9FIRM|nr:AraC family transcriptional regulator [Candidatus Eisenbergiella merdipullorum]